MAQRFHLFAIALFISCLFEELFLQNDDCSFPLIGAFLAFLTSYVIKRIQNKVVRG